MIKEKFIKAIKLVLTLNICALIAMTGTGCWDKVEIDNRQIIMALGIDKDKKSNNSNDKYLISYSIPNVKSFSPNSGGVKPKFNEKTVGPNFFEANRNLTTKTDKTLYYAEAKAIIFGEDILKNKKLFKYMLDVIMRQNQFSKTAVYVSTKGKAEDIINSEPEKNPYVGPYISGLLSNNMQNLKSPDGSALRILIDLVGSGCTIMPVVKFDKKDKDIVAGGCSIIKDYKLEGYLTPNEVKGLLFARGEVKEGEYTLKNKKEGMDFVYEIAGASTDKKITFNNGKPEVSMKIKVEGKLAQYYSTKLTDPINKKGVSVMQNAVNRKIESNIKDTLSKLQNKYKVDVIGIGDYVSKHYPAKWEKIKSKWNDEFSKIKITVKVDSSIRRQGEIEQ
jgi:Ger(x)C family germination protein